jgi:hypothetical protein
MDGEHRDGESPVTTRHSIRNGLSLSAGQWIAVPYVSGKYNQPLTSQLALHGDLSTSLWSRRARIGGTHVGSNSCAAAQER